MAQKFNIDQRWSERAKKFGKRCVIDLAVPEAEYDQVTANQQFIFSMFLRDSRSFNHDDITKVLDYGCGPGRFSSFLADCFPKATVTAYDPCEELLNLAPEHERVDYILDLNYGGRLDYDLAFVSMVFGGMSDEEVEAAAWWITKSSKTILFAEHVSPSFVGDETWRWRKPEFYKEVFAPKTMKHIGQYYILYNEVSIYKIS